ncbi:MAG: alkaline phosphatase family protein [Deltaproteobacteria bacterium]|nr:alkaline phosphatase family protein [Deltaproteobacteria bacterium]MBW2052135.1 alkaline phosphatase family protein [Deltaproteobacteria bacterium]MBW2140645.1 alkaline phosphatase family protein [Deltaproteobacteria bacterium]MBW2322448.1 alkaline phosphatase family protein [Deltaproteobacteria bacterium]
MTGLELVSQWFDSGQLVRPSVEAEDFLDLTRALACLSGIEDMCDGSKVEELCREIGPADHYVFVLIDALGADLVESLPQNAFLRVNMKRRLQSLFPSTTASVLTSLATGMWPCSHGVSGWFMYLEEADISVISLLFVERNTRRSLEELGLSAQDLFPVPSFWPYLRHEPHTVLPAAIVDSVYSNYSSGETQCLGYPDLSGAIEITSKLVLKASRPSLTYLYLPQFDETAHVKGKEHEQTRQILLTINEHLDELAKSLAGRVRIVISADHGVVTVPEERRFVLSGDDPLNRYLRCQPTGEPTVPVFHVHGGHEEAFTEEFTERFGNHFALLLPEDAERLRLFGPGDLSPITKSRLGSFIGISRKPSVFYIRTKQKKGPVIIGYHGGLSSEEMHVPLILV